MPVFLNRIIQWIKEFWYKMTNQTDVKSRLNIDIAISPLMAEGLRLWALMYANLAPWLSDQSGDQIKSLNLPASISAELARQITIEMGITVSGSARADYLNGVMQTLLPKLRQQVEYGVAKGGMVMKPYVANDQVIIDFVQADQFYPVCFDVDGNMTACVFVDQRIIGKDYYTRLEYHTLMSETSSYLIKNQAFKSATKDDLGMPVDLSVIDDWADLEPEATITNVTQPLFAYFRYPMANNIDPVSPLGVSCFSRAIDLIKQADQQWTDFLWEFESGRRALYVDSLAFGKDAKGNAKLPNKRLYQALEMSGGVGEEDLFEEWSPTLREQNLLNGLDAILRKIEYNCGLAYGTLSNPQTVDKTATELKISQQRSYVTITDSQKALQKTLDQLLYAIDVWVELEQVAPAGTYSVEYSFDDSILVDTDLQFQQDMRLVTAGLMSKVEFRMRNFKEDLKTAQQKVADAKAEQPEPAPSLFG